MKKDQKYNIFASAISSADSRTAPASTQQRNSAIRISAASSALP